jgi:RNA polymerase sigma factor (sigma-70 family)
VETPPTFIGVDEPVGDGPTARAGVSPDTPAVRAVSPDGVAGPAPAPDDPGAGGEHETLSSSGVTVTPEPAAGGRPLLADTGVFRVSGTPAPGGAWQVQYALSAHGANGTLSANGSVTLTGDSGGAIITPGHALAARQPEVLTIVLRDAPGLRTARASATLFLAPSGGRVGDSALFEAHRVGRSAEAFATLVQRHGPAVTRACERVVGNRADAEDVSQFVFLRLARWHSPFPGTLNGWLYAVSRNASLAFLRSKRRRLRHERRIAKPVSVEPSDSQGLDEVLDEAIRQLPVVLGEAVRLRYLEGRSQEEAARIVGCPRGTLSRRAAHGIQVLRELLAADRAITG